MLNRSTLKAPASIAFTDMECQLLDRLIPDKKKSRKKLSRRTSQNWPA